MESSFKVTDEGIEISKADSVTLMIAAATSFNNFQDVSADPQERCEAVINKAIKKDYAKIESNHIASHRELFRRVVIDLGTSEAVNLPTTERLENFKSNNDPQFASLVFQYGRYLLISSSRPGSQPANLQAFSSTPSNIHDKILTESLNSDLWFQQ